MDFFSIRIIDIIDIVLVAFLLFNIYKLVRGTAAIRIFIGIVILYIVWILTELLEMELFSKILGGFLGVGMFALIVVFQQEIRRFLLMIGTTNFKSHRKILGYFNFSTKNTETNNHNIRILVDSCQKLASSSTGALIVIKRLDNLEYIKTSGDRMDIKINQPIIESIFYKNSPLHDGAVVVENDKITATRVILPVSENPDIPLRFGLRHRAALGVVEKTDAVSLVVSEENGQISYFRDGEFVLFEDLDELIKIMSQDLIQND